MFDGKNYRHKIAAANSYSFGASSLARYEVGIGKHIFSYRTGVNIMAEQDCVKRSSPLFCKKHHCLFIAARGSIYRNNGVIA